MNICLCVLPDHVIVRRVAIGNVAVVVAPNQLMIVINCIVQVRSPRYITRRTWRAPKLDWHMMHIQRVGHIGMAVPHRRHDKC